MSTVKVDTIQTTGGVSEIAIDKLKGVSAASSISVVGEGGTNTTNLQQGIAKSWVLGTNAAALTDSFNVSGGTDNGTGDYSYAVSTNFGNANFSVELTGAENNIRILWNKTRTTSSYAMGVTDNNGTSQDAAIAATVHGDLA